MNLMSRRVALVASTSIASIVVGTVVGTYPLFDKSYSQETKRPLIAESTLKNKVYQMVSGVYEDAKNFGIPIKDNYVNEVSSEIWPEIKLIAARRFTVIEK